MHSHSPNSTYSFPKCTRCSIAFFFFNEWTKDNLKRSHVSCLGNLGETILQSWTFSRSFNELVTVLGLDFNSNSWFRVLFTGIFWFCICLIELKWTLKRMAKGIRHWRGGVQSFSFLASLKNWTSPGWGSCWASEQPLPLLPTRQTKKMTRMQKQWPALFLGWSRLHQTLWDCCDTHGVVT